MNNLLTGQSIDFTVIGTVQASDDDLSLIASYIGDEVMPGEVAIVEAVAFTTEKNSNGWQVADLDGIDCLGASLNYDHAEDQRSSFGVVFAARNDDYEDPKDKRQKRRKVVKVAVPKSAKTAEVLTDIRFKVASKTSPAIRVAEWQDEKQQIIKSGTLVHLSLVQSPAFGEENKVLSLAASERDEDQKFAQLGRTFHQQNVADALRYSERRANGFTSDQRESARAKFQNMDPMILAGDVLPLLRDAQNVSGATTQKTLSAVTDHSSVKTAPAAKALNPSMAKLFGEDNANGI